MSWMEDNKKYMQGNHINDYDFIDHCDVSSNETSLPNNKTQLK